MIDLMRRYVLKGEGDRIVGRIDRDMYVREGAQPLFHIKGDGFFSIDGERLGSIIGSTVLSQTGMVIFKIQPE